MPMHIYNHQEFHAVTSLQESTNPGTPKGSNSIILLEDIGLNLQSDQIPDEDLDTIEVFDNSVSAFASNTLFQCYC